MVLADHVGQPIRPKLVGERPRCVALEAGRREQVGRFSFGTRAHRKSYLLPLLACGERQRWSSGEHDRDLLPAPVDGNAPLAAAGPGDAIEIVGAFYFLIIDRED